MEPRSLVNHYSRAWALKALFSPEGALIYPDSAWRRCIALVQQLCCQPNAGGLTAGVFQDLAVILRAYNGDDHTLENTYALQSSLCVALSLSPSLRSEFGKGGVPSAFEEAFLLNERRAMDGEKLHALWRVSFCLVALLSISPPEVLDVFVSNTKLLVGFAKCYDTVLSRDSPAGSEHRISKIALRSKVNIIDSVHILFEHCSSRPWAILDMLFPIFDLPTTSPPSSPTAILPFGNRTLLGDYEATYKLSSRLSSDDEGDPRYEFVRARLRSLVGRPGTSHPFMNPEASGALAALLPLTKASMAEEPALRDKGKGKATEPATSNDENTETDAVYAAMSQILDVLPDENSAFLQACLNHPDFHGPDAAEKLLGALLEGGPLPDGLDRLRDGTGQNSGGTTTESEADLVASRRNVFENDPMDFSRLRVGKNRSQNADTVLGDKSFAHDMKADILRRVREQAEEEEEAERETRGGVLGRAIAPTTVIVAHEDELSDPEGEISRTAVIKMSGNDGEAIDEDEEDDTRSMAMLENILELAYIHHPKVFDRDSATRRSKQRADLRADTGWDDEQIEGWRIMLERNPRKDRILARHEFTGNKPLAPSASSGENTEGRVRHGQAQKEPSRGGRGGPSLRRGGPSRGRGRGATDNNTARDRVRKDKAGNQQRRRGHDKKMAQGGAAPAL